MNGIWGESFYYYMYEIVSMRNINWICCYYLKNKDKLYLYVYMVICYKVKKKVYKNMLFFYIM